MPDFIISYQKDGDTIDFNLYAVPPDLLLPLSGALKWEFQKDLQKQTAPDFKQQRLEQVQRHLDHCAETGEQPKELFLDF